MEVISMTKVVRSSKEIMGVDDYVGAEWDAGYVPIAASHRRCRVTVRKDASDKFSVYCVAYRGDTKLASWDIKTFPCETCAKAFSLCLVFGDDYAACRVHDRDGFCDGDLFDGRVAVLCSLMGVDKEAYRSWSDYANHRVNWVVRLICDGQLDWLTVVRSWESAEQFKDAKGVSFDGAVGWFYAEVMKRVQRS
jgi:hypothetical protein